MNGHMGASELPICVAVIICNEIIEDKKTNNKTLVSLFNSILTPQLPSAHPRFFIMASLTSGSGRWPISFRIKGPSDVEIMRLDGEATFEDPLDVVDLVIEVRGLPITEEGVHFVDVMTDSSLLGHRRFSVKKVTPITPPSHHQPPSGTPGE